MDNILGNFTYKGHNWIRTEQANGTTTMSFRGVSLLTDEEYRQWKEERLPDERSYRRLKVTDKELVEFKFGKESPE